jgi:NAD+ kinase
VREITVVTHRRPEDTTATLEQLVQEAARAGVTVRLDEEETGKHRLSPGPGVEVNAPLKKDVDLCLVLGGDGTILRALQFYAGSGVAVFAINFGELLRLPAIVLGDGSEAAPAGAGGAVLSAINDVAIHRKVGERVADIAYELEGEEVGSVRCDGLVVSTPAGSTGYNLANGGPVMAWGVAGFVVSFIAPHSLTARALVVAPGDRLTIHNRSHEPLDVALDGRPAGEIPAAGTIQARFEHDVGTIAQVPGTSFYRRLREKFGRLAS